MSFKDHWVNKGRPMMIALRTPNGWSPRVPNKGGDYCDYCGAKLWIGPTGPYCDAVHTSMVAKDMGIGFGGQIPNSLLANQDLEPTDCGNCGLCPNCESLDKEKAVDFGHWGANKSVSKSGKRVAYKFNYKFRAPITDNAWTTSVSAMWIGKDEADCRAQFESHLRRFFGFNNFQITGVDSFIVEKSGATDETLTDLKNEAEEATTVKEKKTIKSDIVTEQKERQKEAIKERKAYKSFGDFWKMRGDEMAMAMDLAQQGKNTVQIAEVIASQFGLDLETAMASANVAINSI